MNLEHESYEGELRELRDKVGQQKKAIKTLAQTVADFSAMMMPVSGLTMIGCMAQVKAVEKFIGEEIAPSEQAFEGTVKIVSTIRKPLENEISKLREIIEQNKNKPL